MTVDDGSTASRVKSIALVGNFLPRKCGIATFTKDCHSALRESYLDIDVRVYAMNDQLGGIDYPPEVVRTIEEDDVGSYLEAARDIEDADVDAVWVQHEYGIYGGRAGEFLLRLLDRVSAPIIITLHTVLEDPDDDQRRVLCRLIDIAGTIVVMAEKGADILRHVYDAPEAKILVVPHGVPDRPRVNPDSMKSRFGFEGRKVILTFGLLAPSKGVETMVTALPEIVSEHPESLYVVLGATHPNLVASEGEAHRERLMALVETLGVSENIHFIDDFAADELLFDYLQAADVYVTPYLNPAQITSGTLAYAVGLGKAIVATPYVHAVEALADEHGIIVPFGDSAALAGAISGLLSDDVARDKLSERAYARGRSMLWPRLAERIVGAIDDMVAAKPARLSPRRAPDAPAAVDLRAVIKFTDGTGMFQHGLFAVPDRRHGYCVDDNARALLLMTQVEPEDEDQHDQLFATYAGFVQHAWNADNGRFRNFMNYDRSWCEEAGSDDSFGRSLWALGVAARDAFTERYRRWAGCLFEEAAEHMNELESLRARAFAMLGAVAMRDAHPGHGVATQLLESFGDDLLKHLTAYRRPDWTWFESVLGYDNCRLPEALLRAGQALGRSDFVASGIETLQWIIARQKSPQGHFRAVGSDSFGRAYAPPLPFDQQPLEAQATIEACSAAFLATGDQNWLEEAECAYAWFFGINDLGVPLISRQDGGCYDGLMPHGVNLNQGAESILAFQLATAAMAKLSRSSQSDRELGVAAE